MILNAGSAQRAAKGQAVVNERGLLGRIYVTGENTSWVILLTDLNSRVPVVIEPSHRRAILIGDNTPAPQLELDVGDGPVRAGRSRAFDGRRRIAAAGCAGRRGHREWLPTRVSFCSQPRATADAVNILDYQHSGSARLGRSRSRRGRASRPRRPRLLCVGQESCAAGSARRPGSARSGRYSGGARPVTERSPFLLFFDLPVWLLGRFTPFLIAFLLVVLANLPISFTGGLLPAPVLALAAIYFWTLARPDLMPPVAVLVTGLAEDLLSGGPPGLWAAGFLAAYVLIDRQRKILLELNGSGTLIAFTGAMLLSAADRLCAGFCHLSASLYRLPPLLLESVVTVILYPLVARPLQLVRPKHRPAPAQQRLAGREGAMSSFDGKEKQRHATFTRRSLMLSGGITAIFGLIAGRLYQLQVIDGDEYFAQAEDEPHK